MKSFLKIRNKNVTISSARLNKKELQFKSFYFIQVNTENTLNDINFVPTNVCKSENINNFISKSSPWKENTTPFI